MAPIESAATPATAAGAAAPSARLPPRSMRPASSGVMSLTHNSAMADCLAAPVLDDAPAGAIRFAMADCFATDGGTDNAAGARVGLGGQSNLSTAACV